MKSALALVVLKEEVESFLEVDLRKEIGAAEATMTGLMMKPDWKKMILRRSLKREWNENDEGHPVMDCMAAQLLTSRSMIKRQKLKNKRNEYNHVFSS